MKPQFREPRLIWLGALSPNIERSEQEKGAVVVLEDRVGTKEGVVKGPNYITAAYHVSSAMPVLLQKQGGAKVVYSCLYGK